MNQKGFINIILVIVIVALVGAGAYFVLNRQAQKPSSPVIERISPVEAPIGAEISIIGSGFTSTKNSLQFGDGFTYVNNLVSSDGKTITFTPPESFDTCNPDGSVCAEFLSQPFPGQMYEVVVINANGQSNYVNFTVAREEGTPTPTPTPTPKPSPTPTPTPISDTNKCNVDPDESGKCPAGCVNYGVPLGCVTQEYYDECRSGGKACPICLAGNTLIDTPSGSVSVKDLQVGMPIWTTDKAGHHISGVVIKTSKVPVPPTHQMVHLILDDGRELFVSSGHPTIDGHEIGDLVPGDIYDGASVVSVQRIPYGESVTYDVLPSGETGFYWANGILLDSTLH